MTHAIEAARAFFGSHDPGVRIHWQEHPAVPMALGATFGDNVYLHPATLQLSPELQRFVLRHEFAHVLQQRAGCVRANGWVGELPANDQPLWECEADLLAFGLLPIAPLREKGRRRRVASPPVLQCLMEVAGRRVNAPSDLSQKASTILEMIPSGAAWLKVIGTSRPMYRFRDEYELLAGIQSGLHGSPLILLRKLGLSAHPEAFRSMEPEEVVRLQRIETGEANNSVGMMQVKKSLAAHQLWAESEFTIGDEFLKNVGVAGEPLFRTLSLPDRTALFDLVNDATSEVSLNPVLQKEAAAFAVMHAQNPLEFVDLYRFYMALAAERSPAPALAAKRVRFAEVMADSWGSLLHSQLWCPLVADPPTPENMPRVIRDWSARGQQLGFGRLSAALAHVAQFSDLQGATGSAAQTLINRHMDRLQAYWQELVPSSVQSSQHGADLYYLYDLPDATARLRLDADGNLTIDSYAKKAPPPPAPGPKPVPVTPAVQQAKK